MYVDGEALDMVTEIAPNTVAVGYTEHITASGTTIVTLPSGREIEINRYRMEKDIGVTIAHSSKIFTGQRTPTLPLAMRMSQYLHITVEEMYWIMQERPKYLKRVHNRDIPMRRS